MKEKPFLFNIFTIKFAKKMHKILPKRVDVAFTAAGASRTNFPPFIVRTTFSLALSPFLIRRRRLAIKVIWWFSPPPPQPHPADARGGGGGFSGGGGCR
jgi:hypothetical protein